MSKCRLNPDFVSKCKSLLKFIGIIILLTIAINVISFLCGLALYTLNLHEIMMNIITTNSRDIEYLSNVYEYILKAGRGIALLLLFVTIVITIVCLLVYVVITESVESYRVKSKDLKYKFDGIPQPWYRVLLSYIFVCDRTA